MTARISRRKFIGATAGLGAAASLGGATKAFARSEKSAAWVLPRGSLSVQHFSIRDATGRLGYTNNASPTMGYLGGPTFPENPADLGPLVPLPGGFVEVFEYLASVGYDGIEFFGFTQNNGTLGRQPTIAEIRGYLDNAGLKAQGTHTAGLTTMSTLDPSGNWVLSPGAQTQFDNAQILGYDMIGTAGDPVTGAAATTLAGWQSASARANFVGQAAKDRGLRWYLHPEQNNFRFFADPANADLNTVHRLTYFIENTDPELVLFEIDILHAYSGRARFPSPVTGQPDFDVWKWVLSDPKRQIAYHVKDGNRNPSYQPGPPEVGGSAYLQTAVRPGFPLGTGTDAIYSLEGQLGKGYPADPDPNVAGFEKLIRKPKGRYNRWYVIETDSGLGGATDQGRSLRHAKISARNLLAMRE